MNNTQHPIKVKMFGTTHPYYLHFSSISECARHFNVSQPYIKSYIKKGSGSYKLGFIKIEDE